MSKMDKLIGSLPRDDLAKVKKWIQMSPDEVPENPDDAVEKIIFNILWDYNSMAENADNEKEAAKINAKKVKLYNEWKKLGLVK